MDFSTDEKHRETLAVLESVLDYLERLPKHPATHEVCTRVRAHLESPSPHLVRLSRRELHGTGPFASRGLPLLEATVVAGSSDAAELALSLPASLEDGDKQYVLAELSKHLETGPVHLRLQARNGAPQSSSIPTPNS